MKGTRVFANEKGYFPQLQPGEYAYSPIFRKWEICSPTGARCSLGPHKITEHDDGTITASPSILTTEREHGKAWHGYLEHGQWRTV